MAPLLIEYCSGAPCVAPVAVMLILPLATPQSVDATAVVLTMVGATGAVKVMPEVAVQVLVPMRTTIWYEPAPSILNPLEVWKLAPPLIEYCSGAPCAGAVAVMLMLPLTGLVQSVGETPCTLVMLGPWPGNKVIGLPGKAVTQELSALRTQTWYEPGPKSLNTLLVLQFRLFTVYSSGACPPAAVIVMLPLLVPQAVGEIPEAAVTNGEIGAVIVIADDPVTVQPPLALRTATV